MNRILLTTKHLVLSNAAVPIAFGIRLRQLRGDMPQEELARRMKLKRQANISVWEKRTQPPEAETVVRLADALGVEPAELLKDVETDYDRLRKGLPLLEVKPVRQAKRKMAVGESPPGRFPIRGRRPGSR